MKFAFEDLEVYQRSVQFVSQVEVLLDRKKNQISRSLSDQLSRASMSIPLNIAEGNGRWHKADKRQFFWIARGSTFECVPILEILKIKGVISDVEHEDFRARLEVIGKMLTRLIQSQDEKSPASR